jgi:triosephosphate isomerase
MHGTVASVASYLADLQVTAGVEVVVFPPAVYLAEFAARQTGISCGSQNIGEFDDGAHTGELAASMIRDVGGLWTLAGHSERRHEQRESSELVARKVAAALEVGLRPMLCVGETLAEREAGREQEVVAQQLDAISALGGSDAQDDLMHRLMTQGAVGYEPVWAIGTGQTATPSQAQDMHAFIRGHLAQTDATAAVTVRIVYGGSVKPDNAAELFARDDIDGGLVGGASLDATQFSQIISAAGV